MLEFKALIKAKLEQFAGRHFSVGRCWYHPLCVCFFPQESEP
jgi:hypothetical protein